MERAGRGVCVCVCVCVSAHEHTEEGGGGGHVNDWAAQTQMFNCTGQVLWALAQGTKQQERKK